MIMCLKKTLIMLFFFLRKQEIGIRFKIEEAPLPKWGYADSCQF
jgi:hypothetical protein